MPTAPWCSSSPAHAGARSIHGGVPLSAGAADRYRGCSAPPVRGGGPDAGARTAVGELGLQPQLGSLAAQTEVAYLPLHVLHAPPDAATETRDAAEEMGLLSQLDNLAARPEVFGLPLSALLLALQASGGLVNKARRLLLDSEVAAEGAHFGAASRGHS